MLYEVITIKYTSCRPEKIVTIPNFISPRYVIQEKEFNSTNPRILHIGSTENKNLPRVILAISGINCELQIIGRISDNIRLLIEQHQINVITSYSIHYTKLYEVQVPPAAAGAKPRDAARARPRPAARTASAPWR